MADVSPVVVDSSIDWPLLLDTLFYIGGGTWATFERVAMQVEPSLLFVDTAGRLLEAMGHIAIERDGETLQPLFWVVTDTHLAETPTGELVLTGHWPDSLSNTVFESWENSGGRCVETVNPHGPPTWSLIGSSDVGLDIDISRPVEDLLRQQAPMSAIIDALPRRAATMQGQVTRFDPRSASWLEAKDIGALGAFRVRRFGTTDIVRTPNDLAAGTAAISTVHLSKHIAAYLYKAPPLLAYNESRLELRVPVGADLPGLLGRLAVAGSGREPTRDGRSLVYHRVQPNTADHIHTLLTT